MTVKEEELYRNTELEAET